MVQETIYLTENGTLTLPEYILKSLGLKGKQQLIIETTDEGAIILRPVTAAAIEMYTEERIAEFSKDDEKLGEALDYQGI